MFSADRLLKVLHDFNVTKPAQRLSGRNLSKEKNISFDDIYRHAQYWRDKNFIELEEYHGLGRVGPIDFDMKITAHGIDHLGSNSFIKKAGRFIGKIFNVALKIFK